MMKRISIVLAAGASLFSTHAAYAAPAPASQGVFYTDQARGIFGAPTTPAAGIESAGGPNEHSSAMARGLTHDQAREATTLNRPAPAGPSSRHSQAMAEGMTHDQAVAFTTGVGTALVGR